MSSYIAIVNGEGRCGSSMLMRMLDAGGIQAHEAYYPCFEPIEPKTTPVDREWLARAIGKAVKILDPLRWGLPPGLPYACVWMDRDPTQQARSAVRYNQQFLGNAVTRQNFLAFRAKFKRDRSKQLALIRERQGSEPLVMQYEDILKNPGAAAETLACYFRGFGFELDPDAASRVVHERSPECRREMWERETLRELGRPIPADFK